ncbi:MAG TPA: hypothetical protein VHM67_15345 [Gemmatimonadaceae bacterium]|nr:hypothetical protein [Gemmatimonadaceae bacterium]
MMKRLMLTALVGGAVLAPAIVEAQQTTPPVRRRQAPIEIRGQVPTPQVVTVRPREVPAYSRQVLVPNFYDHDFWPSILPAYRLVPMRQVTGAVPVDSATRRTTNALPDSVRSATPADSVRPGTPPAGTATPPTGTPPASSPR